jgi:flavin reductase (DIM6/NTAB) family NADH-FMN oxidoreductase RutF
VAAVNRLALTTGKTPVPPRKVARGYRYESDKFGMSGFTAEPSETIAPPRIRECPVQLEAVVEAVHDLAEDDETLRGRVKIFEVRVQRVYVEEVLLAEGKQNHIDPEKWRPLIMSFQKFYGLASGQLVESRLGQIPEKAYRSPDVDRGRAAARIVAAAAN